MIGELSVEQALQGIEGMSTRFGIDDYDVGVIERAVFGPLEAWVHEIAHMVCLGLGNMLLLVPSPRSKHKVDLSMRIASVIKDRASSVENPWRVKDYQELATVGAELAFMRHLGACQPCDSFEEKVVIDASVKLGVVTQPRAIHLMYWLACRPVSARRAEKIRLILNAWR